MGRVTLATIAGNVGVVAPTVSRVLRGDKTCYVSEETKNRILRCAAELGYTPNFSARNLVLGKTSHVAFVLNDFLYLGNTGPFLLQSINGMRDEFDENGYRLSIISLDTRDENEIRRICQPGRDYDGIIFGRSDVDADTARLISESDMPAAILSDDGTHLEAISRVLSDKAGGVRQIVEHLLENGHDRFIVYGYPEHTKRYGAVFNELGVRWDPCRDTVEMEHFNVYELSLRAYMRAGILLDRLSLPVAICCGDDFIAAGVCRRLLDAGVEVGGSVAIVGFDDISVKNIENPEASLSITTVHNPTYEMGKAVAELLLKKMKDNNSESERRVLSCQLVIGNTSGLIAS